MRVRTTLACAVEKGTSAPVVVLVRWDRLGPVPLPGWKTGMRRAVAIRLAHQTWDAQRVRGMRCCGVCISQMSRRPVHGHVTEGLGFFAAMLPSCRGSPLRFFGLRRNVPLKMRPA